MEVYFVDIGRGTSNLILLGQSRAMVIDCGANSGVLLQLLARFRIEEIVRLILSHNHDDHVGGALGVMTAYEGRIGRICFLEDGKTFSTKYWQKVSQQLQDGTLTPEQLIRLEVSERPKIIFEEKARRLSLKLFSPRFDENLEAIAEGNPNATSGVLLLTIEDRRIVFAGDSTIRQWQRIRQARGRAVNCDILAVNHHAGIVWTNPEELGWLYTEGVRPRFAIVSVATSNRDKHPRPEVIKALMSNNATVVCTQITKQCCDSLEPLRPGVLTPQVPGFSRATPDYTKAGNSRNVACGGTMVAEFTDAQLTLHRIAEHQAAVDRLAAADGGHPVCR